MDGRGWFGRPDCAWDGRGTPPLLPGVRRLAGTGLAPGGLLGVAAASRHRCGLAASVLRRQSGWRIFVRGGPSMSHEPLLTSVVGSHAHPGWFASAIGAAQRGEFGPADLEELLADGVDLAIRDQEEAGVDVITDGEMRRAGFFTAEFYRHLTGVRALPPDRLLGAGGHDQQHRFEVLERIAAPHGPGVD